jgi:thiamine biosynthesis lipoprotein
MMDEAVFPAMGTTAHVLVNGGPEGLVDMARDRIEELEARWSRFRPDSEISLLNRHGSARVGADTVELVSLAIVAWQRTGGRFDPTVYSSMNGLGYSRPFDQIGSPEMAATAPAPGCADIRVGAGVVRLPPGVGFDPGGIGKGLAADLVAMELLEAGAEGAVVNLGGDLRAVGNSESGAWGVRIEEPAAGVSVAMAFGAGAVATSTPLRRVWHQDGVARHHLIDPSRGLPVGDTSPALVSVVSAEAWWAEVCAKAAMLAPRPLLRGLLEEASALVVERDGTQLLVNGMEQFLR